MFYFSAKETAQVLSVAEADSNISNAGAEGGFGGFLHKNFRNLQASDSRLSQFCQEELPITSALPSSFFRFFLLSSFPIFSGKRGEPTPPPPPSPRICLRGLVPTIKVSPSKLVIDATVVCCQSKLRGAATFSLFSSFFNSRIDDPLRYSDGLVVIMETKLYVSHFSRLFGNFRKLVTLSFLLQNNQFQVRQLTSRIDINDGFKWRKNSYTNL